MSDPVYSQLPGDLHSTLVSAVARDPTVFSYRFLAALARELFGAPRLFSPEFVNLVGQWAEGGLSSGAGLAAPPHKTQKARGKDPAVEQRNREIDDMLGRDMSWPAIMTHRGIERN